MRYILLLVFLFSSCMGGKGAVKEFSPSYASSYNNMIRWKRYENMSIFFKDSEDFIRTTDRYKSVSVEKFKILSVKKINDKKYRVLVERSEFAIDSNTLKDKRYYQYWLYDLDKGSWYIKEELNKPN